MPITPACLSHNHNCAVDTRVEARAAKRASASSRSLLAVKSGDTFLVPADISAELLSNVSARMEKWRGVVFEVTPVCPSRGAPEAIAAWTVDDGANWRPSLKHDWAEHIAVRVNLHGPAMLPVVSLLQSEQGNYSLVCSNRNCNLYSALCKHQWILNDRKIELADFDPTKTKKVHSGSVDAFRMRKILETPPTHKRFHAVQFTGDSGAFGEYAGGGGAVDATAAGGAAAGDDGDLDFGVVLPLEHAVDRRRAIPLEPPTSAGARARMLTSVGRLASRVPGAGDQFWERVHGVALDFEEFITREVDRRLETEGGGAADRNPAARSQPRQFRFLSKGELRAGVGHANGKRGGR